MLHSIKVKCVNNDYLWGDVHGLTNLPPVLVERLRHYFIAYKLIPGQESKVHIAEAYGRQHAQQVIRAAMLAYEHEFVS